MGLNTDCNIKANFFEKWITVGKMKELLNDLPDDLELLPNPMGNLNVISPDHKWIGYIDISDETFKP